MLLLLLLVVSKLLLQVSCVPATGRACSKKRIKELRVLLGE
jgi:hypothetical protein